jgi:hypothetical protein
MQIRFFLVGSAFCFFGLMGLASQVVEAQEGDINPNIRQGRGSADIPAVSESKQALNNDPAEFQFAIMGDRTGGMRAGVFEIAARKVNLLQPEFVLSVGDLIDGYTTDPDVWNAQYEEFDAIIDQLEMKFYYVPGNHDISNPDLDRVWRERRGSPWYTFVYKGVLFVALHTEDRKGGGLGPRQLDDLKTALERHQDVRWTLLFMHRPLWSYGNQAGYEQIEEALGDRPYTLFSGHHHHYLYSKHNGRDHYVLATSGGGSYLRGVEFGEFDHITWVTMKKNGPVVAHLELDGIHDKELVTDENNALIQALRQGTWMSTQPVVSEEESVLELDAMVTFENREEAPMRVFGRLDSDQGVRFIPSEVDLVIAPGERLDWPVTLRPAVGVEGEIGVEGVTDATEPDRISIDRLNQTGLSIELSAEYEVPAPTAAAIPAAAANPTSAADPSDDISTVRRSLPARAMFRMDWLHKLQIHDVSITIDADLSDWNQGAASDPTTAPFIAPTTDKHAAEWFTVRRPVFTHEDWDWRGPEDGQFRFGVRLTQEYLYLAIEAEDERILRPATGPLAEHQDQFYLHISQDTGLERLQELPYRLYNQMPVPPDAFLQIRIGSDQTEKTHLRWNDPAITVSGEMSVTSNGDRHTLIAEIAVPASYFASAKESQAFRLNVGWMDHDRPENTKPSTLWWRPGWGFDADYEGSATFTVQD